MSAKLLKIIQSSSECITCPNDSYNSKIITAEFKKNSGGYEYEYVKISVFYGKPKCLVIWQNGKIIKEMTLSTSKLIQDGNVFSNKVISIKVNI